MGYSVGDGEVMAIGAAVGLAVGALFAYCATNGYKAEDPVKAFERCVQEAQEAQEAQATEEALRIEVALASSEPIRATSKNPPRQSSLLDPRQSGSEPPSDFVSLDSPLDPSQLGRQVTQPSYSLGSLPTALLAEEIVAGLPDLDNP